MKISGLQNIQKIMKSYSASKPQSVKGKKLEEDKIDISQEGRDYQFAMKAFKDLPEIRSDKVEAIRADIQSGTYKVDKEKLAKEIIKSAIKDVKL